MNLAKRIHLLGLKMQQCSLCQNVYLNGIAVNFTLFLSSLPRAYFFANRLACHLLRSSYKVPVFLLDIVAEIPRN